MAHNPDRVKRLQEEREKLDPEGRKIKALEDIADALINIRSRWQRKRLADAL